MRLYMKRTRRRKRKKKRKKNKKLLLHHSKEDTPGRVDEKKLCVLMEGKREEQQHQVLRKGPWKAEEDEVLITHVKKYGPRDWSSIRSKGLLQRTGKSCRLRWVNKLRPNLKNGCKFSAEEERVVIELQAQFGNKWARIATYLPGRTDNDVKNFWSSRQKRLARILQASSSKQHKHKREVPVVPHHNVPTMEVLKLSSSAEEESTSIARLCATLHVIDPSPPLIPIPPPPDLPNPGTPNARGHLAPHDLDSKEGLYSDPHTQISFPHIPLPQLGISFWPESQELMARLDDPNYFSLLDPGDDASELVAGEGFPPDMPLLGPSLCCTGNDGIRGGITSVRKPDVFYDDLPLDVPDQFEPLPSPSKW